jgi:hypothetical protein
MLLSTHLGSFRIGHPTQAPELFILQVTPQLGVLLACIHTKRTTNYCMRELAGIGMRRCETTPLAYQKSQPLAVKSGIIGHLIHGSTELF